MRIIKKYLSLNRNNVEINTMFSDRYLYDMYLFSDFIIFKWNIVQIIYAYNRAFVTPTNKKKTFLFMSKT